MAHDESERQPGGGLVHSPRSRTKGWASNVADSIQSGLGIPSRFQFHILLTLFFVASIQFVIQILWRFHLVPPVASTAISVINGLFILSLAAYVLHVSHPMRPLRILIAASGVLLVTWGLLDLLASQPNLASMPLPLLGDLNTARQVAASVCNVGIVACLIAAFLMTLAHVTDLNHLLTKKQEVLIRESAERASAEAALRASEERYLLV